MSNKRDPAPQPGFCFGEFLIYLGRSKDMAKRVSGAARAEKRRQEKKQKKQRKTSRQKK